MSEMSQHPSKIVDNSMLIQKNSNYNQKLLNPILLQSPVLYSVCIFYSIHASYVHLYPFPNALVVYNPNRKMEKASNGGEAPFLPFLYQLRHQRRRAHYYYYCIFAVEAFFVSMFPLNHSARVADRPIAAAIRFYQQTILINPVCILIIHFLFFLLPLLLLLTLATLYLNQRLQDPSKYQPLFKQLKKIFTTAIIALEVLILPGFLLAAQNLVNCIAPDIKIISYINFPCAVALILLDSERRLYRGYSILMVFIRILLPFDFGPMVMVALSYWLGSKEPSIYKRVVYFEMGIWSLIILAAVFLQAQLDFLQLLIALTATAASTILSPHQIPLRGAVEENEGLMRLVERLQDGRELTMKQKMQVSKAIFSFKEELKIAEKQHLTEKEEEWAQKECTWGAKKEEVTEFIVTKIAFQLRKEYSHRLKIQQLQCQFRLGHVTMKTLYQLQALILQLRNESSFAQRQKLYQLVSLADQRFLNKEQTINASSTIARERQTERLYEIFMNIAVVMQEFWTLHRAGRLGSRLIGHVLRKVEELENEAQGMLWRAGKHGSTRHELVFFQFLRKLVNNSNRPTQWPKGEPQKQELLNVESRNYILIEQGNILAMSNRLLNEFQLSRKEAEGYKLVDIVNQQTAQYLSQRLDKLIQDEEGEDASFLLPLKVSREKGYIMPYRAQVQILPELMNGIKYILHLQKPTDLQRTPSLLYCGNSDSIIGITRNFLPYFRLTHDHYLFRDFTHEIFNADLLAIAQGPAKEGTEIICDFRAKRTTTRIEGRTNVSNVPVVLRKLKQYDVAGQTLVLFNVIKREELERTQLTNLISEKIVFVEEARESKEGQKDGLQGKTFCRIANPYQNLIDEKVSKMDEFYRMSFLKGLLLVLAGLLLILLASLVFLPLKLASSSTVLMENYNVRIVQNDKAINTLQIFTQSSILYQLYTYPQQYLAINPNYDIPALIKQYGKRVDQGISAVLEDTIQNEISGVSSNSGVSIYDILGNAKLSIVTHDIAPLIASWPAVNNITAAGRTQDLSVTNIDDFFQYFSWAVAGISVLLLLAAQCLSYKAEEVFQEILHLYEKIDSDHAKQFSLKYRLFAYELYSSSYFRGVRADEYLRNYRDRQSLDHVDQVGTLLYIEKIVGIDMQQEEVASEDEPIPEGEVKVGRKFFLSFLWKEGYIILPLLFFLGFLQFFLWRINSFQDDFSQVISHSVRLHQARGNISYNTAYFMTSTLQEVLPKEQRIIPDPPSRMYLTSELSTDLPEYFQSYQANVTHVINADLCKMNLNTNSLYFGMTCGAVLGGILREGYPETNIFFNDLINQYSFNNMSSLGTVYGRNGVYPVFIEVLYVRRSIYNLITSIEKDFQARTQSFIEEETQYLEMIGKSGWILLPIFVVVLVGLYLEVKRKCAITLKSFFILPKEYLLEMRVTKVLRQRDILNRIERLAF